MKKTIKDEVFGKITFDGMKWVKSEPESLVVAGKTHELKIEIESVSSIYDKIQLGFMKKEVAELLLKTNSVNEKEALSKKETQRRLYSNTLLKNKAIIQANIEDAMRTELSELMGNDSSLVPNDEWWNSLQLTVARVFLDRIEIKCKCDWYEYGGGFILIENGECLMRPIDSLSF